MYYQGESMDNDTKILVTVSALVAALYLSFAWVEPLVTLGLWLHS